MKIHLVFHIFLLKPYKESTIPGRLEAPPLPIEIDGKEEYEVSEILDSCINWKKLEYLVYWQSYKVSERTWEPAANIINISKMLQEFYRQYPHKPSLKNV